MTTIVKVHRKGQTTLPSAMCAAIGIAEGDFVEATLSCGKIVLTPKSIVDRSAFPNADNEYTPQLRRYVDARLAKSDEDIREGRTYGPLDTAGNMIAHLKEQLKSRTPAKKLKRKR